MRNIDEGSAAVIDTEFCQQGIDRAAKLANELPEDIGYIFILSKPLDANSALSSCHCRLDEPSASVAVQSMIKALIDNGHIGQLIGSSLAILTRFGTLNRIKFAWRLLRG